MPQVNLTLPIYVPERLFHGLRQVKRRISALGGNHRSRNLLGDRDIEWSWTASQIDFGSGEALDFGNGGSFLGLIAAQSGFNTTAIDMGEVYWPYSHPRLHLVQGDILSFPFPDGHFDLVINCSTVEHVGLVGRYGVSESRINGDLEAMARLNKLMRIGGKMILTVPVGVDQVFAPLCRVYGAERLPRLLQGFSVVKECYWIKDDGNKWIPVDRETALGYQASVNSWDAMRNTYALGCFVLLKSA